MNTNIDDVVIRIHNLIKYFKDIKALDGLTLEVRKGEVFGFLGPNGAGKTTSINIICGLLKADDGEVLINGRKISDTDRKNIRSKIGVCPQNIIIWPKLTCYEQLVFMARMYDVPGNIARRRADDLLTRLELQEKRNRLAHTLSGGMQRRLNILLALVHDPELIIFDEPEAGLDPQSRLLVRDFIIHTARDKTVIFTTHNMDEADRISDRIAIIDRGKLLKLDTTENLKKSIGEGDILELTIQIKDEAGLQNAIGRIKQKEINILRAEDKLTIQSRNMIEKIPLIYKILEDENIQVSEMNMRENTLEDVFIHLTGRTLRQ